MQKYFLDLESNQSFRWNIPIVRKNSEISSERNSANYKSPPSQGFTVHKTEAKKYISHYTEKTLCYCSIPLAFPFHQNCSLLKIKYNKKTICDF